jgi:hypothetical protein
MIRMGTTPDAIRVGDTVFDNMRPNGISFADFEKDIGGFAFLRRVKPDIISEVAF